MAAQDLAIYPQMPFYRGIFEAAGVAVAEQGWSDEMIDAAIPYGDADGLVKKVRTFFEAGADEVVLSPFGVGDDPVQSQADCIQVLSDMARGE